MITLNKLTRFVTTAVLAASLSCTGALALNVGTITGSSLHLRQTASTSAASLATLTKGTKVAVLSTSKGWVKVAVGSQTGYVSNSYITGAKDANFTIGTGVVTGSSVNMRKTPSKSGAVVTKLAKGTAVNVIGVSSGWFKVKTGSSTGYIHPDYLSITKSKVSTSRGASGNDTSNAGSAASGNQMRSNLLDYAANYLGTPYRYGSKGPSSFDCSGFTSYVYKKFGVSLSSSSSAQYSNTSRVSKSDLLPGDLVFFSNGSSGSRVGHVGIYVGNNKFIHASSPGDDVKYDSLSSSYYKKHYISGGRVISD